MTTDIRRALGALILMLVAALGAWALTPTHKLADQLGPLDLEAAIPTEFGDWQMLPASSGGIVNPQQTAVIEQIYTQTLSRTYLNRRTGEAVMLSIAYGEDQRDNMQAHLPEICYPAQGFQLKRSRADRLQLAQGEIPLKRVETFAGQRLEPVSYWIMVGEHSVLGGSLQKKFAEMRYSLSGYVPDGLLFRVSSINRDSAAAFVSQDAFLAAIVPAINPAARTRMTGLQ